MAKKLEVKEIEKHVNKNLAKEVIIASENNRRVNKQLTFTCFSQGEFFTYKVYNNNTQVYSGNCDVAVQKYNEIVESEWISIYTYKKKDFQSTGIGCWNKPKIKVGKEYFLKTSFAYIGKYEIDASVFGSQYIAVRVAVVNYCQSSGSIKVNVTDKFFDSVGNHRFVNCEACDLLTYNAINHRWNEDQANFILKRLKEKYNFENTENHNPYVSYKRVSKPNKQFSACENPIGTPTDKDDHYYYDFCGKYHSDNLDVNVALSEKPRADKPLKMLGY